MLNSGVSTKMTLRALWWFILEVRKVPRRRSVDLACLSYSQCLGLNNEKVTLQKQPPQESSEAKANADQKDCKSSSNLCWKHLNKPQKVLCLLPKVFGPYIPQKRKKIPLYFNTRTSYHDSSMVAVVELSEPAFLLQDLKKHLDWSYCPDYTVFRPLEMWTNVPRALLSRCCAGSSVRGN